MKNTRTLNSYAEIAKYLHVMTLTDTKFLFLLKEGIEDYFSDQVRK